MVRTNITKSSSPRPNKTQLENYLLEIVLVELIRDSDGGEDGDHDEREGQNEGQDVAVGAGTRAGDQT